MNECYTNDAGALVSNGESSPRWLSARILLTRRECEILTLLEKGLSNKDIAVKLEIEVQTVKNHVHHIFGKLGLKRRREALQYLSICTGHAHL